MVAAWSTGEAKSSDSSKNSLTLLIPIAHHSNQLANSVKRKNENRDDRWRQWVYRMNKLSMDGARLAQEAKSFETVSSESKAALELHDLPFRQPVTRRDP